MAGERPACDVANIVSVAVDSSFSAIDDDLDALEGFDVFLEGGGIAFWSSFGEVDEATVAMLHAFFKTCLRAGRWYNNLFLQSLGDGGHDGTCGEEGFAVEGEGEAIEIFDLAEGGEELGLEGWRERGVAVRVLEVQAKSEVIVELAVAGEMTVIPGRGECLDIFYAGDHAVFIS